MNTNFFENLVEQKLLTTHTLYLAKVLSMKGNKANIQPLSLAKLRGQAAVKQAVIQNVPISQVVLRSLTNYENEHGKLTGKTVIAACMERDITRTKTGVYALPSLRRHSFSDSIIIGFL